MAYSWRSDEAMLISPSSMDCDSALMASSGSSYDDVVLPSSIWSKLPRDLIEHILKRVAFRSLTGFRAVSKGWNSLILSPDFSAGCQRQDPPKCVPVLVPYGVVESGRWSMMPFNSERNAWEFHGLPFLASASAMKGEQILLSACSGGLMCFETKDRKNFVICNPITKQWKQLTLPTPECVRNTDACRKEDVNHLDSLTGLVVNQQTGSYILVVASLAEGTEVRTLLYDSSKGIWFRGAPVPPGKRFVSRGAVTFNGNIYTLVKNPRDGGQRYGIWRVLKYSVQADQWSEVAAETRWHGLTPSKLELVQCKRQLLLVARELDNRWLPNNTFFKTWYNTFYKVTETSDGRQLTLVKERRVSQSLRRSTVKIELAIPVGRYPDCFAGSGDFVYALRILQSNTNEFQVQKIRATASSDNCEVLPSLYKSDPTCLLEMKTFEASRTFTP